MPAEARASERRFRIVVRRCRGCGREWPAHLERCSQCAAVLGEPRAIECSRVVPPSTVGRVAPAVGVAIAVELSRREPPGTSDWAPQMWGAIAPLLESSLRVRPGPTGSILAVWRLESSESLIDLAGLALELGECAARAGLSGVELRGGVALGVIGGEGRSDAVERSAERLALVAAPGQWLVSEEVARRLEDRFVLRPVGIVARWTMAPVEGHRALVARLAPPILPSALAGGPPGPVFGRAREQRRLLLELELAAAGSRRVLLVSAPAGGGKSYLLRRVLADAEITLAAGVAFPPLGSRTLDPLRALLADLGAPEQAGGEHRIGEALAHAALRRARTGASAIVVDDVHWAGQAAVAALASAISACPHDAPIAWILSARSSALPALGALVELTDLRLDLKPLPAVDRVRLLGERLGAVPEAVSRHVALAPERGNPLYLEHLAGAIAEGSPPDRLPRTLHEAVLARLEKLAERARRLTHLSHGGVDARGELETLELQIGDWLDRLETSDIADLATIARYLARLRAIDVDLVVARSVLGMPVSANRRLGWAIERLAAASTDALLGYLETVAGEGRESQATYEARAAAERAERALRLADASRLLAFASRHDSGGELTVKRGDIALALGRPDDALRAYRAAASRIDDDPGLERRIARALALCGQIEEAVERLASLRRRPGLQPIAGLQAALDLARLGVLPPPALNGVDHRSMARRLARASAWSQPGDRSAAGDAIRSLVLSGDPVGCAVESVETAALAHLAGLTVAGLNELAADCAQALQNPLAAGLLRTTDSAQARRTFLHWEI